LTGQKQKGGGGDHKRKLEKEKETIYTRDYFVAPLSLLGEVNSGRWGEVKKKKGKKVGKKSKYCLLRSINFTMGIDAKKVFEGTRRGKGTQNEKEWGKRTATDQMNFILGDGR